MAIGIYWHEISGHCESPCVKLNVTKSITEILPSENFEIIEDHPIPAIVCYIVMHFYLYMNQPEVVIIFIQKNIPGV